MPDVVVTIAIVVGVLNLAAGALVTVREWRRLLPPTRSRTMGLVVGSDGQTFTSGRNDQAARMLSMIDQFGRDRQPTGDVRDTLEPGPAQKVLVIEDDVDLQEMLVDVLTPLGYEVYSAHNGVDGLAMIRAGRASFSVVLLDIGLAGMNGFEFLAVQGEDPSIDSIPVIVMSGRREIDENNRPKAWVHTLHKPMMAAEVIDAVGHFAR